MNKVSICILLIYKQNLFVSSFINTHLFLEVMLPTCKKFSRNRKRNTESL